MRTSVVAAILLVNSLVGLKVVALAEDIGLTDPAFVETSSNNNSAEMLSAPHGLVPGIYDCRGNGREYSGMIEVTSPLTFTRAPRSANGTAAKYTQTSTVNGTNSIGFVGAEKDTATVTINTDGSFKINFDTPDGGKTSYICIKR